MALYHDKAKSVARAFHETDGCTVVPFAPHTSMFHVCFDEATWGSLERLLEARDRAAEACGVWLFGQPKPSWRGDKGWFWEVWVGEAALGLEDGKLERALEAFGKKE